MAKTRSYKDAQQTWNPKSPDSSSNSFHQQEISRLRVPDFSVEHVDPHFCGVFGRIWPVVGRCCIPDLDAIIRRHPCDGGGSRGTGQDDIEFFE